MQGNNIFTEIEIKELRQLVKKFSCSNNASERKSIRSKFRRINFYVSDFEIQNIDLPTFNGLLKSGQIKKEKQNSIANKIVSKQKLEAELPTETELLNIEKKLINCEYISAAKLESNLNLDCTGFYCIKLKRESELPPRYQIHLDVRKHPIIYIGKAEGQTLRKRFLGQELRARGHGTFFRSIGAVLGYLPEKGSLLKYKNKKNYRFAPKDEADIITWINKNLEVNFIAHSGDFSTEKRLIQKYSPLLNHTHNPLKLKELITDKAKCRWVANNNQ